MIPRLDTLAIDYFVGKNGSVGIMDLISWYCRKRNNAIVCLPSEMT